MNNQINLHQAVCIRVAIASNSGSGKSVNHSKVLDIIIGSVQCTSLMPGSEWLKCARAWDQGPQLGFNQITKSMHPSFS